MKEEAYKVLPDILKELINVVYRVKDEVSVLAGNHNLWKNKMITYTIFNRIHVPAHAQIDTPPKIFGSRT